MGSMPGGGALPGELGKIGAVASRFGPWGLAAAAVGIDIYALWKNVQGEQARNRGRTPEQLRARGAAPQQAYAHRIGNSMGTPILDAHGFPTGRFSTAFIGANTDTYKGY
jgi:hypothetical protein